MDEREGEALTTMHESFMCLVFDSGIGRPVNKNICITFEQCWTSVEDVGPTLYKYYTHAIQMFCIYWAGIVVVKYACL